MMAKQNQPRQMLLSAAKTLVALGLNKGTSGNISIRHADGFLITPSGVEVGALTADSMVQMGHDGVCSLNQVPSSEWRFHMDIYRERPDVSAIVHTHSTFATTLSTLRKPLPAFHYMVAVAGGEDVRCAPYALFGSQLLSDYAVEAMRDRHACLLANHGLIAVSVSLDKAIYIAHEIEVLCEQYIHALSIGQPIILSTVEMQAVINQFKGYGALANK